MEDDPLFERIWNGTAPMEEWTASVRGGAVRPIAEGIAAIHTGYLFGNVTAIRTGEGLVLIDSGSRETGAETLSALRGWSDAAVHTVIYTHGHIDHTVGAQLLDAEAEARDVPRPRIFAHRNVLWRFDRYDSTHALSSIVMGRQFDQPGYRFPDRHRRPDEVYDERLELDIGGERIELQHGRGETDDATWVWLPSRRVLASGDFVIWAFPNAGNPRKAQRYAADWARALKRMEALAPEVLIPGHGPVIFGASRVAQVVREGADILESLVGQTLALMNEGCSLDDVLHGVRAPVELLTHPWLRPNYDDPEFVVRNLWHLYGGWFDGDPAHLKPAPAAALAAEIAGLAGGARKLAERAAVLAEAGETRIAAHLAEFAARAEPGHADIQAIRASILRRCGEAETSLIGKAIFAAYRREAEVLAKD